MADGTHTLAITARVLLTDRARGVTPGTVAMTASMLMAMPSSIMPCCVNMRDRIGVSGPFRSTADRHSSRRGQRDGRTSSHPHPQSHPHTHPCTHLAVDETGVEPLAGHGLGGEGVPDAEPGGDGGALAPPQIQHAVLEAGGCHRWFGLGGVCLGCRSTRSFGEVPVPVRCCVRGGFGGGSVDRFNDYRFRSRPRVVWVDLNIAAQQRSDARVVRCIYQSRVAGRSSLTQPTSLTENSDG